MTQTRFLIVITDGVFAGASLQTGDLLPLSITEAVFSEALNAARPLIADALEASREADATKQAAIDTLRNNLAQTKSEFDAYQKAAEQAAKSAMSVILDPSVSDADTVAQVKNITTKVLQTPREREREELLRQRVALESQIASLA